MVVVKQEMDVAALMKRLGRGRTDEAPLVATLQRLNPHADFARLPAGTVLLLPERETFEGAEIESVAGEAFSDIADELRTGLKTAAQRIGAAYDRAESDRKNIASITRRTDVKRIIDGDPQLRQQVAAAEARFEELTSNGKQVRSALGAMDQAVAAELEELGRLML
jgi:vacuolar-type H+-ATPase subunit I/STV1